MNEIVRADRAEVLPATPATDVLADLERFEDVVQQYLAAIGLPADDVFVEVAERHTMLSNMPGVLGRLDEPGLDRSFYISKMIAAVAVGLFDAALNYLWNELVNELRRRVVGFDLRYFFDIAAPGDLRKHLKDEDDLARIEDQSLLRAAREIGLLSEVGFQRLDHIRYMRNHASAAHPNQVTITGLDLANWLQVCIREVIMTPPDTVTAETGRLLGNLKKDRLDENAVMEAALFFDQLPPERADTLANGFFGLFTDPARSAVIADNVRTLWPDLWQFVGEDTRRSYGVRHARATANAETDVATAARELIDLVDGAAYLNPEIRAVELKQALEELMDAHQGYNNFHTEGAPARRVRAIVGDQGDVPAAVRTEYIKTIVETYLGNGYGVSAVAAPVYREMLQALDGPAAGAALRLCVDPVFQSLLSTSVAERQWEKLLDIIEPKLTSTTDRSLMAAIRDFTGRPSQLALDTKIKLLARPKFRRIQRPPAGDGRH